MTSSEDILPILPTTAFALLYYQYFYLSPKVTF